LKSALLHKVKGIKQRERVRLVFKRRGGTTRVAWLQGKPGGHRPLQKRTYLKRKSRTPEIGPVRKAANKGINRASIQEKRTHPSDRGNEGRP